MGNHNPQSTALDFLTVLQELDLKAERDSSAQWRACGRQLGIALPADFLQAMSLGADQLLTRHSNDEVMQPPAALFDWNGVQALPLLWENQGNFVFGLALDGQSPAPVLIAHDFAGHHNSQPVHWQVFAPNFATFAFARLLEYQYLFSDFAKDAEWFFNDVPATPALLSALTRQFKQGPTSPDYVSAYSKQDVFTLANEPFSLEWEAELVREFEQNPPTSSPTAGSWGLRHRFYRKGQRVMVSVGANGDTYWEISAATQELFRQLQAEISSHRLESKGV